jgi:glycosyltransferase involved in cell wall biosynthesis
MMELPSDKPIIAVIGCISPVKGYIELFAAIRDMPRDFRVLLIGDTPAWICPEPETVVRAVGWMDDTIIRKAFVPESKMPTLFGAIDAVALLYREPNGSSGILTLCQQFGVPVLSTCFGEIGAKVMSQNLGVTADPNNPEEVRGALRKLLARVRRREQNTDGPEREADATGTRGCREGFSLAGAADAHLRLYRELWVLAD